MIFRKAKPFNVSYYLITEKDDFEALINRRKRLIQDFSEIRVNSINGARRNYYISLTLMLISIVSSSIAGVLGLLRYDSTTIGIIAFGPTIVSLVGSTFNFHEKANWFYKRKDIIDMLYHKFSFEGPAPTEKHTESALLHVEDISKEWAIANQQMSFAWEQMFKVEGSRKSAL